MNRGRVLRPVRPQRSEVCPLPTRIVLSYLTLWAQRSSSQAQLPGGPLAWRQRTTASGAGAVTYIGPTVVTCLEIRWPTGFWFSGPAPSRYSQPKAGRSATECERGRGLSALAGTPIAESALVVDVSN